MKPILLVFFLGIFTFSFGQEEIELKRKYRGTYEGVIPEYRFESSRDLLFVAETPITIKIGEDRVSLNIGSRQLFGSYSVMFEADKYYLLDVVIDGQSANERIIVYKRGKKLSRDGMFPQPVTRLEKVRTGLFGGSKN